MEPPSDPLTPVNRDGNGVGQDLGPCVADEESVATDPEMLSSKGKVRIAAAAGLQRVIPLLVTEAERLLALGYPRGDIVANLVQPTKAMGLVAADEMEQVEAAIRNGFSGELLSQPDRVSTVSTEWHSRVITADDLRTQTYPPIQFIVPQFIGDGVTLLASRPKLGKSWFALDLALAVAGGRFTLGTILPAQGAVLYLALEDSKRRLQRRIHKLIQTLGTEWPRRLALATDWRRADDGGLRHIEEWCDANPDARLIIIDTLEKFRPAQSSKNQAYSADYQAISALQSIANARNIGILILHHDRKAEAIDPFDTVSGTLGLTGAADTILILKRTPNGFVLHTRGRDIEESEMALQFNKQTCKWTILGLASEVHRSNERSRVIAALKAAEKPLSPTDILVNAELTSRNATDILLRKMAISGEIERIGRGLYSLPSKTSGQIGQKERLEYEGSSIEMPNLSNLSDLSGGSSAND